MAQECIWDMLDCEPGDLTQKDGLSLLKRLREELASPTVTMTCFQQNFQTISFYLFELFESIVVKKDYADAWGMLCRIYGTTDFFGTNVLPSVRKALSYVKE